MKLICTICDVRMCNVHDFLSPSFGVYEKSSFGCLKDGERERNSQLKSKPCPARLLKVLKVNNSLVFFIIFFFVVVVLTIAYNASIYWDDFQNESKYNTGSTMSAWAWESKPAIIWVLESYAVCIFFILIVSSLHCILWSLNIKTAIKIIHACRACVIDLLLYYSLLH